MEKKWKLAEATDSEYNLTNAQNAKFRADKKNRESLISALDMLEKVNDNIENAIQHTNNVRQLRTITEKIDTFLTQFKTT